MVKRILIAALILILPCLSYAGTLPLFSHKYERTPGKPDTYTAVIDNCNSGATYTIVVENGNNGKNRVSSASITLNGIEVISENEFNQKVDKIEKSVPLLLENTLSVRLQSVPGSFITVTIQCAANCMDVSVTSPDDGSSINRSTSLVRGVLYNAVGETGITITNEVEDGGARVLAQREREGFAGIVPLQVGANRITATAMDACGEKATDTVTISAGLIEEKIRLTAIPSSGIMSLATGTLEVTFNADVYMDVSNYLWDFEGDGEIDTEGSGLSTVTFGYRQTGLYFPSVTVIDASDNTYTETTVVNVLSREEMDAILKGKWEGMRGELTDGDIERALRYFSAGSKEKYREIFSLLSNELPSLAAGMQDIEFLYAKGNTAKYRVRRNQTVDGQTVTVTYYVYFTIDENGLWKIVSF